MSSARVDILLMARTPLANVGAASLFSRGYLATAALNSTRTTSPTRSLPSIAEYGFTP